MFGAELTGVTARVGMFIDWGGEVGVEEALTVAGNAIVPDGPGIGWDRCRINCGAVGPEGSWRYVVVWVLGRDSVISVSLLPLGDLNINTFKFK